MKEQPTQLHARHVVLVPSPDSPIFRVSLTDTQLGSTSCMPSTSLTRLSMKICSSSEFHSRHAYVFTKRTLRSHITSQVKCHQTPIEGRVTHENSTRYLGIPPSTLPHPRPPQPSAPALPHQTSRGKSARSIPPSSSSLTSPSYPSSRPTWMDQRSRVSSTLHSHSHFTHQSQSCSAQLGTEVVVTLTPSLKRGSTLQWAHVLN
ncbi:hypothetical protein F5148DRAFT_467969 [Russula earlei]|uniref:Uncharacterized protein n=1 Tax=Russula earlei TaxID=71964 RepID=A0ACC0UN66_9AGAM|nr:hypothetical protein F5148DRAFT_467969 [Russula earlei]